jgi:glycosyltransferase involved in cell wall biosynthesis
MGYDATVLMNVYNAAPYLRQSISSILNQTFSNFEFLIIDDGSTDESVEIIRSFNDTRIRLCINEKNLGIMTTLNKGLSLASCDLVARLDADDISYPERLQLQFDFFQQNPDCVLLSTSVRVVSDSGEPLYVDDFDRLYNAYNVNFICPIYQSSVMYRKNIVEKIGGYRVPYGVEDFDLWLRLSREYKIDHLQKVLLDYRMANTSFSNVSHREENRQAQRNLLLEHVKYFAGNNFQLTFGEIECLRHDFSFFEERMKVKEIVACIIKLDYLNNIILTTPNLNYSPLQIVPYAENKRDYIVYYFYTRLPRLKAISLLLRTQPLKTIFKKVKNALLPKVTI